ncbi:Low affinity NH4+ transporter [Hypocenomyce scalaris]|nr:Low affinity NH4+ transporter [Hypocenomyce scalaris]
MTNTEDEAQPGQSELSHEKTHEAGPPSNPAFSMTHEVASIAIICAAQLLTQAGFTQAITPLHIIGDSFGVTNPGHLSWYAASYSLTVGTFILVAGRLGDMFGHKKLFLIGFLWFALWSLIAGVSVYSGQEIFFDVCRALQGIGPAMLLPNALAILGRTYPPGRRKEMVFSLFGATAPSGGLVGAAFSGMLGQFSWWPWAYWCLAIACCACAAIGYLVIPACPPQKKPKEGNRFDYAGAITGIAGLVLFNVAWNQAPVVGWRTPYVYILLIVGVLSSTAFFFIERKVAQPLVPMDALSGKVGFVLGCVALGWSSFGIWVFYLWQMWEVLRMLTPLNAAAQMVPVGISGFCAAVTTGFLLSRLPTPYIMAIALTAFCVGNILLATMPVDQIYWTQTFLALIITPWGMDMSFPAATIILSDFVLPEHQGIGASLVITVVNYSISIGLGIAGTVEVHVNNGGMNPADILKGYRGAWYSAVGLSGLGVLFSLYFALDETRKIKRNVKS